MGPQNRITRKPSWKNPKRSMMKLNVMVMTMLNKTIIHNNHNTNK